MSELESLLLLPGTESRAEAIRQFARDVAPLAPNATEDERAEAIDFLLWAISGGKVGADGTLSRPFPSSRAFAQLFRAVGGELPAEMDFALAIHHDLAPAHRRTIEQYFAEILSIWTSLDMPPLAPQMWRKVSADNITSIAVAYGVKPEFAKKFRGAIDSITYLWGRSFRFAYLTLPLIALCLPFVPVDFPTVLRRHPRFGPGIRALQRITRIGRFIASTTGSTPGEGQSPHGHPASVTTSPTVGDESFESASLIPVPRERGAHQVQNGIITVPNNPVVATLLESLWQGGPRARHQTRGWSARGEKPVFERAGRQGGRIHVYPAPEDAISLWSLVESFNPFTTDVAFAVLAEMTAPREGKAPRYPLIEPIEVTPEALLRYKRLRSRSGRNLRERVCEEMERLLSLRFDVEDYPFWERVTGGRRKRRVTWRGDRLFDAVTLERWEATGTRADRISWLVRAGQWAYWWFDTEGRLYISKMARLLLELDHRQTRATSVMAKKIGEKVILLHRANRSASPIELQIEQLLAMVGELPRREHREKQWAGRAKERFDEAMLTLQERGIFTSVTWPEGYGPGDPDRHRGWVDRWLSRSVRILPGGDSQGAQGSGGPSDSRLATEVPKGAEAAGDYRYLRSIRSRSGWSQSRLAQRLGISTSYLSQIENGRRIPSSRLEERLIDWILEQE